MSTISRWEDSLRTLRAKIELREGDKTPLEPPTPGYRVPCNPGCRALRPAGQSTAKE